MDLPRTILIAATLVASTATAQTTEKAVLEKVEAGVADVGPLDAGMRAMQVDLRQPFGFDSVYRIHGRDDVFVRGQGGLYAVFPQSVYANTRNGSIPLIPHGTTFYIGEPALDALAPEGPPAPERMATAGPQRIDPNAQPVSRRKETPVRLAPPPPPAPRRATPARIVDDASYRRARLTALMQRAAEAATQPDA